MGINIDFGMYRMKSRGHSRLESYAGYVYGPNLESSNTAGFADNMRIWHLIYEIQVNYGLRRVWIRRDLIDS